MHQASVKRSDTEGQKPPVTPSAQGEAGALTWVSQEPEEGFFTRGSTTRSVMEVTPTHAQTPCLTCLLLIHIFAIAIIIIIIIIIIIL